MKTKLIEKFCTTRKRIDEVAKKLNLSNIGTREEVLNSIKQKSYAEIKKAISEAGFMLEKN